MHGQCADLLERIHGNFHVATRTGTDDLMKELLVAQDKGWQGGAFFSGLPGKLGITGSGATIYFLQGFKEVARLIPLKVFDGDQSKRNRLLQSIQQALDTVIENETIDG